MALLVGSSLWLSLQDSIGLLLDAVRTSNEDLAQTWKKFEEWATIEQLCSKSQWFQLVFKTHLFAKEFTK